MGILKGAKESYQKNKDKVLGKMIESGKRKTYSIRKIINDAKTKRGCSLCSENHWACLDLHHLDKGTKDKSISGYTASKSITKLLEEIPKCICVCSNCHRKIHYDNDMDISHIPTMELTEEETQALLNVRGRIGLTQKEKGGDTLSP